MAISFPVSFIGAQSVANPLTKTYGAAVAAGDVLVAFVYIYNASETCTGVSDSVNGAWVQAFGPVNAGNGTRIYGFYKLNSAAGTPTVSASFSSTNHHEIEISVISGLAGGGAFDQEVSAAGLSTNPSVGPTSTLGAAVCAAVAGQTNSGVVPSAYGAGWTLDVNLDLGWQKTSFLKQVTSTNAPLTASWTQGNSYWNAGIMVFKDAGGGAPTLAVADGAHGHTTDPVVLSALGVLTIADSTHGHTTDSITLTAVSNGTITIPGVSDWETGLLKTGQTGVQVDIYSRATGALVVRKTGQTTHATTADCVVFDATIVAGTTYRVVTLFADGSLGVWDYTAT